MRDDGLEKVRHESSASSVPAWDDEQERLSRRLLLAHRDSGRPTFASSDDEPVVPPPAEGSAYGAAGPAHTTNAARLGAAAGSTGPRTVGFVQEEQRRAGRLVRCADVSNPSPDV